MEEVRGAGMWTHAHVHHWIAQPDRWYAVLSIPDEVNAVVVDLGSFTVKVGYAGEDTPKHVFPSVRHVFENVCIMLPLLPKARGLVSGVLNRSLPVLCPLNTQLTLAGIDPKSQALGSIDSPPNGDAMEVDGVGPSGRTFKVGTASLAVPQDGLEVGIEGQHS